MRYLSLGPIGILVLMSYKHDQLDDEMKEACGTK